MARAINAALPENPGWCWRNLRRCGLRVEFWPLDWALGVGRDDDVYGGQRWLSLGPLCLTLCYSIGDPNEWLGLSENEAWERAVTAKTTDA